MNINPAHLIETALLVLAAYLLGCIIGYGLRRVLHAGRGTRQVSPLHVAAPIAPVAAAPAPRRPFNPAARLAASVDDIPPPLARPVVERPAPAKVAPSRPVETPAVKAPAKPRAKPKKADPKPPVLAAPRGSADNLKKIKGIGPKIESSLHAMGIFHIDQIAAWSDANIDWVETQLAFKGRIGRQKWVEQARELNKANVRA